MCVYIYIYIYTQLLIHSHFALNVFFSSHCMTYDTLNLMFFVTNFQIISDIYIETLIYLLGWVIYFQSVAKDYLTIGIRRYVSCWINGVKLLKLGSLRKKYDSDSQGSIKRPGLDVLSKVLCDTIESCAMLCFMLLNVEQDFFDSISLMNIQMFIYFFSSCFLIIF